VITLQEIIPVADGLSARIEDQGKALLALDPDHDGRLTAVELRTIAERYFASVDVDGDGTISAEEFVPVGKQRQAATLGVCSQVAPYRPHLLVHRSLPLASVRERPFRPR
jgi:Ca2+-binding EF-hand superfamily protein